MTVLRPMLPVVLAFVVASATQAETLTVDVSADATETSTRLVLTHSDPAVYIIHKGRKRVSIRYSEPVIVRPSEMRFDGGIVERYRVKDDRTVVFHTGPEFTRYESFELRNPYRLILDLQGGRRAKRSRSAPHALPTRIIVIDPGHGGIEHGAVGPGGLREKDLTLALARRLKLALQQEDPSISVVLTRDEDRLVGLDERTGVANHNRADLFLSIHANASPRAMASGAETYYLSTEATDDEARILAALENRSADGKREVPSGTDPGNLDLVLWDLAQKQYLAESSALAESVQRHLNWLTGTRDRGVRQAPFRVLMGAMMPAILVEVGFISNPDEEIRLQSPAYRTQIVRAMTAAVREFLLNLDRLSGPASPPDRGAARP